MISVLGGPRLENKIHSYKYKTYFLKNGVQKENNYCINVNIMLFNVYLACCDKVKGLIVK